MCSQEKQTKVSLTVFVPETMSRFTNWKSLVWSPGASSSLCPVFDQNKTFGNTRPM